MARSLRTSIKRGLKRSIAGGLGANDIFSIAPLDLRFAQQKVLDSRITFTRASSGTYVGADGLIKTATTNEARFDHNPTTGESLGLLVEESRTNSIVSSQSFNSGSWIQDGISLTPNAVTAPDGTITATSIIQGTGNNRTYFFDNSGITGNKVFTIFAKANTGTSFTIQSVGGMTPASNATINLSNGTISNFTGATIQPFANGWYRIILPVNVTIASGNSTYWLIFGPSSSVYIWGAQLETGSFPTSYIPTTSSTVTRSADVASITGTNFSSWYNQSEGTLYSHYTSVNKNQNIGMEVAGVYGGSSYDPFIKIAQDFSSGRARGSVFQNNAYQAILEGGNETYYTAMPNRVAFAVKANNFAFAGNGGAVATDTSGTLPQAIRMSLFEYNNARSTGIMSRLTYWPTRLPDATLQEITR